MPYLWVTLGGIAMGLTPDPFRCWWLAWVALVPLWLFCQGHGGKRAIAAAGLWGFAYHGMALFWITGVHPMDWMGVPWGYSLAIAITVWLVITGWGVVLTGLWALLMARLTPNLPVAAKLLIGCAAMAGLETLWSWGPLYWTALGYTQSPDNLVALQLGRLSGQQGLSVAIVAVNGLLAEAWRARRGRYGLAALGLGGAIALYGAVELTQPVDIGTPLKVGIIQGNIPNRIKLRGTGIDTAVQNYTAGYRRLAAMGVELVLTPETAIPLLYPDPSWQRSPFDQAVAELKVPVWLGTFRRGPSPDTYFNSLVLLQGAGTVLSHYDKVRLVPLGEYIPLREVLGGIIRRLSPLRGEVAFGDRAQRVSSPWGPMVVGICYESAFPAHFRYQAAAGGRLMLTASNNAHYAASMPAQHHAQDVARAVEIDRWAVRATNTGYSGIVDPHGRTLWYSGFETTETHAATVYLRDSTTPFVRWGDWVTPLLLVGANGYLGRLGVKAFHSDRQ
jgi:apolipoprotein N-acyltransferase